MGMIVATLMHLWACKKGQMTTDVGVESNRVSSYTIVQ
eukprot:CAMPEP_0177687752 /NCGR_PEP_ID=MMETSP0447-20121125/34300_1 /TAXON_ID=0 /ORGANISM="Stygamoeba regulata, Strain BSH-02190019" /LENGTH=37 /DNA_ID= /DNA_START= /DNA_END= /DNA_ORIENTATION=